MTTLNGVAVSTELFKIKGNIEAVLIKRQSGDSPRTTKQTNKQAMTQSAKLLLDIASDGQNMDFVLLMWATQRQNCVLLTLFITQNKGWCLNDVDTWAHMLCPEAG